MKCQCGYEGIPTVIDADSPVPTTQWGCPACHAPAPLGHDPIPDEDQGDWVCSKCGMRGPSVADLHTDCPGRPAPVSRNVYYCTCGEWAVGPPGRLQKKVRCVRCGAKYPDYLPE